MKIPLKNRIVVDWNPTYTEEAVALSINPSTLKATLIDANGATLTMGSTMAEPRVYEGHEVACTCEKHSRAHGTPKATCAAVIRNADGHYLVAKRATGGVESAIGGKPEPGEMKWRQTAMRELQEELGILPTQWNVVSDMHKFRVANGYSAFVCLIELKPGVTPTVDHHSHDWHMWREPGDRRLPEGVEWQDGALEILDFFDEV